MEKIGVYLFYIFFLYIPLFSSSKANPVPITITKLIETDTTVTCNYKKYMMESELLQICGTLQYSTQVDIKHLNMFLCLGAYDALYKVCNYSKQNLLKKQINDTKTFTSSIKEFIPSQNTTEDNFCKQLSGLTPAYEKIKEPMTKAMEYLNDSSKCKVICFDLDHKFNPLCAITAWIHNIDLAVNEDLSSNKGKNSKNADNVVSTNTGITSVDTGTTSTGQQTANMSAKSGQDKIKSVVKNETKQETGTENNQLLAKGKIIGQNNVEKLNNESKPIPNKEDSDGNDATHPILSPPDKGNDQQAEEKAKESGNNKYHTTSTTLPSPGQSSGTQPEPLNKQGPSINSDDKKEETEHDIDEEVVDNPRLSIDEPSPHIGGKDNSLPEMDQENINDPNHIDDDDVLNSDENTGLLGDTGNQKSDLFGPSEPKTILSHYPNMRNEDDSHFFTYFTIITLVCIAGYVGYHNKQKVLAIVLEGRRSRSSRGRRRPSTANYRKLDCTLEEAVTSQCNANVTHVIY